MLTRKVTSGKRKVASEKFELTRNVNTQSGFRETIFSTTGQQFSDLAQVFFVFLVYYFIGPNIGHHYTCSDEIEQSLIWSPLHMF